MSYTCIAPNDQGAIQGTNNKIKVPGVSNNEFSMEHISVAMTRQQVKVFLTFMLWKTYVIKQYQQRHSTFSSDGNCIPYMPSIVSVNSMTSADLLFWTSGRSKCVK